MSAIEARSKRVRLWKAPIGLFYCGDTLCLKTEYGNNEGRIDAYIVESGEFFWGGAKSDLEQREILVTPAIVSMASQAAPPANPLISEPEEGSRWRHRSGRIYTVLFLVNDRFGNPKYPRTVVYQGENGKRWAGALSDWHRRMTLLPDGVAS